MDEPDFTQCPDWGKGGRYIYDPATGKRTRVDESVGAGLPATGASDDPSPEGTSSGASPEGTSSGASRASPLPQQPTEQPLKEKRRA